MQHHAHASRSIAPHIIAQQMAGAGPPIVMPSQQQQQKSQPQHANNGPGSRVGAVDGPAILPHMRDQHSRLHQHPQLMHSNSQMNKLRQQHQHINHNNNNTNNKNQKSNYRQHQYNGNNNNPGNTQSKTQHNNIGGGTQSGQTPHQPQQQQAQNESQSQRSSPPQQQHAQNSAPSQQQKLQHSLGPQPHHSKHMFPPAPFFNHPLLTHQQLQPLHHHGRNQHHPNHQAHHTQFANSAQSQQKPYDAHYKSKFTNNVLSNVPKSILQNPNRAIRGRSQNTSQTNNIAITPTDQKSSESDSKPTSVGNNIVITPSETTSAVSNNEVVSNITSTTVTGTASTESEASANSNAAPTSTTVAVATNSNSDSAKEIDKIQAECKSSEEKTRSGQPIKSDATDAEVEPDATDIKHSKVLPNEDSSVLKNSKEKTPMCLVNELARFNKITHQYRLTNEKGPAHCKRFTVTLKLGDEEYFAEGFKIKKAQHLAAAEAIEKTKYKHPVPKINRRSEDGSLSRANITPTVELNALAMKLGQQTYYLLDPRQVAPHDAIGPTPEGLLAPPHNGASQLQPPHGVIDHLMSSHPPHGRIMDPTFMRRNHGGGYMSPGMQHGNIRPRLAGVNRNFMPRFSRYPMMAPSHGPHNMMPPHPHVIPSPFGVPNPPCKVTLIVGTEKFFGTGRTVQHAKHDAATQALRKLKEQATTQENDKLSVCNEENDSKSPISLVHEIGIKRSMNVNFKVLREAGPAHMKSFLTACIVGNIQTEGEGNGKKISKKRAAEKMLEELKKLPPLSPTGSPVRRIKTKTPSAAVTPNVKGGERRKRSSIKERTGTENDLDNPITRLIQLQQNRKEKEPVFELIARNGNENSRRREFIVEVSAQGKVARGAGNNKKLAKRNAAQNLLNIMEGNDSAAPKQPDEESSTDKNSAPTSVVESGAAGPHVATPSGQVPGILILRQKKREKPMAAASATTAIKNELPNETTTVNGKDAKSSTVAAADTTAADVAVAVATLPPKGKTDSDHNTTAGSSSDISITSSGSTGVSLKDQLLYLAKLLGFEVAFSDYPKGNHKEFLTIVTLSTEPPQICHGFGANAEESRNDAASSALKILSKLGMEKESK